ncbi:MAG: hypothetical protein JXA97_11945 [Anaerolineales bacterium]|nr:hypothetical protein [Anaerolineales bacterium]
MQTRTPVLIAALIFSFLLAACQAASPASSSADPSSPAVESIPPGLHELGRLDNGVAYAVYVQGDLAFVGGNDGVTVIDITDRVDPRQMALIETREAIFDVFASGDLVYIAGPVDGLLIADVSDPAAPEIIGGSPIGGINNICVFDDRAYAGTQSGELHSFDVADPARPQRLGSYAGRGAGLMIACAQDAVYFSSASSGLEALDVSNPSAPVRAAGVAGTSGAKDGHIVDDLLFLACYSGGGRIVDITDPLRPQMLAAFNDGSEAWGVGGNESILYIGDLQEGVLVYDSSDPGSPVLLARDPSYAPHDVFFDGTYAYLADQDNGFVILTYSPIAQP